MATIERANACKLLCDEYDEAIDDCDDKLLCPIEGLSRRHTYSTQTTTGDASTALKSLMKELRKELPKQISADPTAGIFVRYDEDNPQFLQACLVGVQGTPYESGAFVFDIFIPNSYPSSNCLITHSTKNASMVEANNGPGGFSPNLHRGTGKVCLSLLGTWDGPGWEAGKSNVYQCLSTLLWAILGAQHPYYVSSSKVLRVQMNHFECANFRSLFFVFLECADGTRTRWLGGHGSQIKPRPEGH
jgi:ubiquitin-protein ligase